MTQAEMLAEIAKAMTRVPVKDGPVGVSARELAEAYAKRVGLPVNIRGMRDAIRQGQAAGVIRCVGKAPRPSIDGMSPVPVYAAVKGR